MSVIVISAELATILEASAPSAADVAQAFQGGRPGAASSFGWVGPRPRVTREARAGDRFYTRVAWLGAWPAEGYDADAPLSSSAEAVRASVESKLNASLGNGWTVRALPYAPAVNGSLAWWQSGEASNTATRDQFPELAGRLDAVENATGPTGDGTHPSTAREIAEHAGEGAARAASAGGWWLALGALAALVLVVKLGAAGSSSGVVLVDSRGRQRRVR